MIAPSNPSRPIGCELEDLRHVIGRGKRVGDTRGRRATDAAGSRSGVSFASSTIDARAFGADERARDVEAVLRAAARRGCSPRRAAGSRETARGSASRVPIANRPQAGIDLAAASALRDDGVELGVARRRRRSARCRRRAGSRALRRCRRSCRRAANACRTSCCRSCRRACSGCASTDRAERELVRFGARRAAYRARRPAARARSAVRIDLEDPVHVLREVEDDRDVAALAGEARAGAAREHRRAELPARRDSGGDVVGVARNDEADRDLAVVGAVGGVQARLPASNRTSPLIVRISSGSRSVTATSTPVPRRSVYPRARCQPRSRGLASFERDREEGRI